jgi:hypothetical protein
MREYQGLGWSSFSHLRTVREQASAPGLAGRRGILSSVFASHGCVNPRDFRAIDLAAGESDGQLAIALDVEDRITTRLDRDGEGALRLFHEV